MVGMSPVTLQFRLGVAFVAEQLGMQVPHVISSVSRLVRHGVLQRTYDEETGQPVLSFAQDVVDLATRQAIAARYQQTVDDSDDDDGLESVLDPDAMYERDGWLRGGLGGPMRPLEAVSGT